MADSLLSEIYGWPAPNYTDPATRGPGLVVAGAVFGALGTLLTALRFYTRLRIVSSFGLDDVFIVLAAVASLSMMVTNAVASAKYGWSIHIWDVPSEKLSMSLLCNLISEVTFTIASTATKLSLLWFCRRLVSTGQTRLCSTQTLLFDVSITFIFMCFVTVIIVLFLQCRPLKAYWDPYPTYPYTCIARSTFLISASSLNSIGDLLTTLAPITVVWRVRLPRRQKIAVILMFSLGFTVCISGAVRVYHVHVTQKAKKLDTTWVGWPSVILGDVEIGLGLIVSSVPALRPFIQSVLPRLLGSTFTQYYARESKPGESQSKIILPVQRSAVSWQPPQNDLATTRPPVYAPGITKHDAQVTQASELTTFYVGSSRSSLASHNGSTLDPHVAYQVSSKYSKNFFADV